MLKPQEQQVLLARRHARLFDLLRAGEISANALPLSPGPQPEIPRDDRTLEALRDTAIASFTPKKPGLPRLRWRQTR